MHTHIHITLCFAIMLPYTHGSYVIDDSVGLGRTFDGIGAISGGGATSKLLVSYPEETRNQILDYLFKPQFGASLDILKVEIGGDADSGCGSESSHMHESYDERYDRGYEWWIMTEAKKRNPNIKLYGLPWAFPAWIGDGIGSPYSNPNITAGYIRNWIQGAKRHYNLTIDYIGIWNERPYDIPYIKTLRKTLDDNSLKHVQIVASDNGFGIENDMINDRATRKAISIIGVHYPGTHSTPQAMDLGTTLWASEDYSTFNDNVGAGCWARILNQNYVNGHMTSTIAWNIVAAYFQDLPFGRDGLMTAMEPWGGHYVVESPIWITAHTTQFTDIGWKYLAHGSGVGRLAKGGSYVSLMGKDYTEFTLIIETMSREHSPCIRPYLPPYNVTVQTVSFVLKGCLASIRELNVYYTKLGFNGDKSILFEEQRGIKFSDGTFSLDLGIDEVYTLSTMRGTRGHHGKPEDPRTFPLPFKDFYDGYAAHSEAEYFTSQVGVWEIVDSGDAYHKMINRQMIQVNPIDWCANSVPIMIGGNYNWSEIYLGVDMLVPMINGSDGVFLAGRVTKGGCDSDHTNGIFFFVFPSNGTYSLTTDLQGQEVILKGKADVKRGHWYNIVLMMRSTHMMGYIDGKVLFMHAVPVVPSHGFVGYGTDRFGYADFDNFVVEDDDALFP